MNSMRIAATGSYLSTVSGELPSLKALARETAAVAVGRIIGYRRLSMNFAVWGRLFYEEIHYTLPQRVFKQLLEVDGEPIIARTCRQLCERGVEQLGGDVAVGRALCDQVDHREFGVGEAVPARFCPRLADDAPLHT